MDKFEPTIVSVAQHGYTVKYELPWDASIEDVMHAMYTCLVGMTFDPETVLKYMEEFARDRMPEERKGEE